MMLYRPLLDCVSQDTHLGSTQGFGNTSLIQQLDFGLQPQFDANSSLSGLSDTMFPFENPFA